MAIDDLLNHTDDAYKILEKQLNELRSAMTENFLYQARQIECLQASIDELSKSR